MTTSKHKYILILWLIISTVACIYVYSLFYDINRGCDITSANDEWEHQSMAVNYAKGYGLYKLGAYTNIQEYHLDSYDVAFPFLKTIFTEFPTEYYYRSAGFSVIAGTLYQLTDTAPYNLRVLNFVLILFSWLIICYTIYCNSRNIRLFYQLLWLLPVFICINFYFINLIGDDTLVVFTLAIVFYSLTKWLNKTTILTTIVLICSLLFSAFIKSTLIFVAPLLLVFIFLFKEKRKALFISSVSINIVVFTILFFYSQKINEKNNNYIYADQQKFHTAVMNAEWTNTDSTFIQKNKLHYKATVEFDYAKYKEVAAYIFERSFYTKRDFFLTGQSLYLFVDGNNEACSGVVEKHIGSWKPFWKTTPQSYFYSYNGETSPYAEVIKFYLQKPFFIPLIMYKKLFASYHWNYLFIILCILQLFICGWLLLKPENLHNILAILFSSIIVHLIFQKLFLTPFFVAGFIITFFYLLTHFKFKTQAERILFYVPYFFTFYFLILTLILYGIDRYTKIASGMTIVSILILLKFIVDKYRSEYTDTKTPVNYTDYLLLNKKNILFAFGLMLIILFSIFACKFGVSNTDEFLALVGIKNQNTAYCFDVVNILKYINYFFYSKITVYNFRLTKVFYNVFNFIVFAFLLYSIFIKKSEYYLKHFKTVLLFLLLSFFSFQFNRGIHYNDIIDIETVIVMLIAIHIYLYPENKINYILIIANAGFAALLFITKFPLGLLSVFILFCMIWLVMKSKLSTKIILTTIYLLLFAVLVFAYFKRTYGTLNALLENYRFFKTFFTKDRFYVYTIDIYLFFSLIAITILLNLIRNKIKPFFTQKKILLFFSLFIIAEVLLFYFSSKNRIAYLLYYILFDTVLYSITIGIVTSVFYHLIRKKEYKKLLLFSLYSGFIFICFWGSMTLQLVNLALHPLVYACTVLLGLFLLQKEYLIKYFTYLACAFFIFCSIFNPYIYNNSSIFSMNTKCRFPENETFYVNEASAVYYKDIREFLQPYKNYPIVDFDFLNVLYYAEIVPYLEPNFVDDQPSEISCNQLRYFKELGKGAVYPKLTISSSPVDSNFYKCLNNYYNIKLGDVVFASYDPTSGFFKKITSNDSVYIHQVITDNNKN